MKRLEEKSPDLLLADQVERDLMAAMDKIQAAGHIRLPKQSELAVEHGVSLRTIRTVVSRLKAKKRIRSIKGKGMFLDCASKEQGSILLVIDDPLNHYTSMILAVAHQVLMGRGLVPVVRRLDGLDQPIDQLRGTLVLAYPRLECSRALAFPAPYCAINDVLELHWRHSPYHQVVRCNNYLWGYLATKYLLCRGKEQILFFELMSGTQVEADHVAGYRNALEEHGMVFEPANLIAVQHTTSPVDTDQYCQGVRKTLQTQRERWGAALGVVDFSCTVSHPQSPYYHKVIDGVVPPDSIIVKEFAENIKAYNANAMVVCSMSALINRAVDLVLGKEKPFSICETHDHLSLRINEDGTWREYEWRSFLANLATGTAGKR